MSKTGRYIQNNPDQFELVNQTDDSEYFRTKVDIKLGWLDETTLIHKIVVDNKVVDVALFVDDAVKRSRQIEKQLKNGNYEI